VAIAYQIMLNPANYILKFATSMFRGYTNLLLTQPLKTKMITSGIISGFGDMLCQKFAEKKSAQDYSYTRTLRQSSVACLYSAPIWHKWFGTVLPWIIRPIKFIPARILTSALLENTIMGGFSMATSLFLLESLKSGNANTAIDNVQEKFAPIMTNAVKFWSVISLINHTFVPVHLKVLVNNVTGIVWQSYVSHMVNAGTPCNVSEQAVILSKPSL